MSKKKKKTFARFFARIILIGFLALVLFFAAVYYGLTGPLPSKDEIASIQQETASIIYSADKRIIGKIFAKNRTQADSSEVPEHLIQALVATEDKRFFEHQGVDYNSYLRVIVKSLVLRQNAGGGSTITQQLVKNLYGRQDLGILSLPVSKIREAILATRFEEVYTKHQLILLYFNTVPFGENTWGVEAAALRYFDKKVEELTVSQSALLVGMLKANTAFNPRLHPDRAKSRRNIVLALMRDQAYLTQEQYEVAANRDLELDYTNYTLYNPAGHFSYQVEKQARSILADISQENGLEYDIEKDGLEIETTLNFQLQELAIQAIKDQLTRKQNILSKELRGSSVERKFKKAHASLLEDNERKTRQLFSWNDQQFERTKMDSAWQYHQTLHAAFLAIDPQTGHVLSWVGGNNYRYVPYDLVKAKRQAASTFKPIIYAAALERGFTPCDYFNNESVQYEAYHNWPPRNYDGKSGGEIAMWYALSRSMNIPSVDVYFGTSHDQVLQTAGALGIQLPREEQPSVALGSASVSLLELTKAYAAIANSGYYQNVVMIKSIRDKFGQVIYEHHESPAIKALSDSTAHDLTQMLRIAVNEGTGRKLRNTYGIRADLAGKTGTSQDYSDAWFMSFNPSLVCGVWVGAMDPAVHFKSGANGSGSALALPIAGNFYKSIERQAYLKRTLLSSFPTAIDSMNCEGIKPQSKVGKWIDNVFIGKGNTPKTKEPKEKKEGFFKRMGKMFKRKKDR